MINPNKTRYASRHDVVKTVEHWAMDVMPEYTLKDIHIHGESVTHFMVRFRNPGGHTIEMTLGLRPNQHEAYPGWHVINHRVWWVGHERGEGRGVTVYPEELETLMIAYPNHRIIHVDNEEEKFPVFGYGVIDADNSFVAFIQHPRQDTDDEDYWANDDLPHSTLVTDRLVLSHIDFDMHDYLDRNLDQLDAY